MRGRGHIAARAARSSVARFVVVTDTHIGATTIDGREDGLRDAIADAATWGASHVLALGDLSSNNETGLTRSMNIMRDALPSGVQLLCITGNHEFNDENLPNTTNDAAVASIMGLSGPPFCWSTVVTTGDLSILVIGLEQTEYGGTSGGGPASTIPGVVVGDRIGSNHDPVGGTARQFGTQQLAWLRAELAKYPRADGVLLLIHAPPAGTTKSVDYAALSQALESSPRSCVAVSGHTHATPNVYALTGVRAPGFLKCPELTDCSSWGGSPYTRLQLSYSGNVLRVDLAEVHGATGTSGWAPVAPFTVAS